MFFVKVQPFFQPKYNFDLYENIAVYDIQYDHTGAKFLIFFRNTNSWRLVPANHFEPVED